MKHDRNLEYRLSENQFQDASRHIGAKSANSRALADDDLDIQGMLTGRHTEECDASEILRSLEDGDRPAIKRTASTPLHQAHATTDDGPEAVAPVASPATSVPRPAIPNYGKMAEANEIARTRRKGNVRQRRHRAKPKETSVSTLYNALKKATARPRGDKLLQQLRTREQELALFRNFSRLIIARHTQPLSNDKLAHLLQSYWDGPINGKKVWQLRRLVTQLEADGMPWHNL